MKIISDPDRTSLETTGSFWLPLWFESTIGAVLSNKKLHGFIVIDSLDHNEPLDFHTTVCS